MKDKPTPEQEAQVLEAAIGKTTVKISGILADLGNDEFSARAFRKINMLPISQRTAVIDYLCENSYKYHFDVDKLLYYSILGGCEKAYDVHYVETDALIRALRLLGREFGDDKIKFTMTFYQYVNFINDIEAFELVLAHFDQSRMNKTAIMKDIISKELTSCLAAAEQNGWLNNPQKRDEMIKYASDNGKTESAAWLLDFKNRTADVAAEREKAEKKMLRELNADPNSLTELRKIWKFEKRGDNTIIITGYKGDRTEVTVPEKIGNDIVAAIGEYAFSPDAKRIREEQRDLRKSITKITLPDTIENIGEFAFFKCKSLSHINIPEKLAEISKGMLNCTGLENIVIGGNIKMIGAVAFYSCFRLKSVKICEGAAEIDSAAFYKCSALENLELPRSVTKISEDSTFWGCRKLTVLLHKGSYAESYCENSRIIYKYTEK